MGRRACSKWRCCLRTLRGGGSFSFSARVPALLPAVSSDCPNKIHHGEFELSSLAPERRDCVQPRSLANTNVYKWAGLCRSASNEHIFGRWNWGGPRTLSELSLIVWQCFLVLCYDNYFYLRLFIAIGKERKNWPWISHCAVSLSFLFFIFGRQPSGWVLQFIARLLQLSSWGVNVTLAQGTALCLWKGCYFF